MGIDLALAEAIVREHRFRPIKGDVLSIARQTMYFSRIEAIEMVARLGIKPTTDNPSDLRCDDKSLNRMGTPQEHILDADFFRLLGVDKVRWLDHSDYEGADIIHDLNRPVPDSFVGCCDFLLDGSTIDNVFNPAQTLMNFAKMLRHGGRLISINMASNDHKPYVMPSPFWYHDYLVMNNFQDVQIYFVAFPGGHDVNSFALQAELLENEAYWPDNPKCPYVAGTVVLAEKGRDSTADIYPSQHQYRLATEWVVYKRNIQSLISSERPHQMRSQAIQMCETPIGFVFVPSDAV